MIERAKVVLAMLEAEDRADAARLRGPAAVRRAAAAGRRPTRGRRALDALIAALAAIHPDEMSPREALEALYALKQKARRRALAAAALRSRCARLEPNNQRARERHEDIARPLGPARLPAGKPRRAGADPIPNRTVTIVVTSAAGAATDVLTRAVAQRLSQKWGQCIIVENRGGGGHNFAATAVMKAEPDGHTLLASETGFCTSQPHLYAKGKLAYDPDTDFVPLAGYASIPMGCWCIPSVPRSRCAELIALAKQKPGALTYGTAGVGTAPHTAALLLESLAGIKLTAVHYRGAAPALNDLIAGHINMITMGPSVALPSVKAGKINMLGFGSLQRVPQLPDVPTIAETVPGYDASVSFGLFAPSPHAARASRQDQRRRATDHQRAGVPREVHRAAWWCSRCPARWRRSPHICKRIRQMGQGHQASQPEDRLS